MPCTLLNIADAVVTKVSSVWSPSSPDAVSRLYLPDVPDIGELSGRQVFVTPHLFGQNDIATRAQDRNGYTIYVFVAEKFPAATAGEVTRTWLDTRVDFVMQIWAALTSVRTLPFPSPLDDVIPTESRLISLYDDAELRENKVFHATLELTYERDE